MASNFAIASQEPVASKVTETSRPTVASRASSKLQPLSLMRLETGNKEATVTQHQRMCIEVSRNFMKIENTEHQNAVNTLIKSLIKDKAA